MALHPALARGLSEHDNHEVTKGAEVLQATPSFVEDAQRKAQDVFWAGLFLLMVCGTAFYSFQSGGEVLRLASGKASGHSPVDYDGEAKAFQVAMRSIFLAGAMALAMALLFLQLAKHATTAVVWTSLLLGPLIMIGSGMIIMSSGWPLPGVLGLLPVCMGLFMIAMVFCFWSGFIPFTALLLETVIGIMEHHPAIVLISMFGSVVSVGWSVLCIFGSVGLYVYHRETIENMRGDSPASDKAIYFLTALIFLWGSMVATNVSQVACCGVFGRWYFGKDRGEGASPVLSSLKVACVTSFGSICFGSFIVAFIRALEMLLRRMRQEAREDGNIVLCILVCVVQSVVACIGDIIEWFNSFAYVQCALRGLGFVDAARATYALCTFANVQGICANSLVASVVVLGAIPCSAGGALVAWLSMSQMEGHGLVAICTVLGFVVGTMVGIAALQPLQSGATTVVVCWAEDPQALQKTQPQLHAEYCRFGRCWLGQDSSARTTLAPGQGAARDLRATPMLEMQQRDDGLQRQMQVTVPPGVSAGQMLQCQTPEGMLVQVEVPAGYSAGQQFVATY